MSFAYYSASYRQEKEIAEAIIKSNPKRSDGSGRRIESSEIFSSLIGHINAQFAANDINRQLIAAIRLALKLNPYAGDIATLYTLYAKAKRAHAEARFPGVITTINACKAKNVPLPVIISCAKYMGGAQKLQRDFTPQYFGITPIIICGDVSLDEEKFDDNILSLPVDDTYEGVPLKMLELFALLAALDEKIGVFKIDDDITVIPGTAIDQKKITILTGIADYMGISVGSPLHDRIWHYGKCVQPTPFSYGKPVKANWARGGLYYLSGFALQTLAKYYLRFPGTLEGEVYEDKVVGDMLYENNIRVVPFGFEEALGLDSTSPER